MKHKYEFFMRPCGIPPLTNSMIWDIKSGLNRLPSGPAVPLPSLVLCWVRSTWVNSSKRTQASPIFQVPTWSKEASTSLPGQIMRALRIHAGPLSSLALFRNHFRCLNRHWVDQRACSMNKLLLGEWMKGRFLLQEPELFTGSYFCVFVSYWTSGAESTPAFQWRG